MSVIDNSGAIIAECIKVMSGGRYARLGKKHGFAEFVNILGI